MNQKIERDEKGRIRSQPIGDKPLSKKTMTIRLDEETDQKLRQIPNKNEFIRKVLAEAVQQYYQD
jgi:hypothetical protein